MNENIRKVYVEFHNQRRLRVKALTEQRRIQLIEEDGRENSPHIGRDALYWALEQLPEEDDFNDFAEMIVKECAEIASDYDGAHYVGTAIELHFGVE